MGDIVERLYRLDADHCGVIGGLGEGAREIERLRSVDAALKLAKATKP